MKPFRSIFNGERKTAIKDSRKELRTFVILTIGLSAVFNYLIITKGMLFAYVFGVMWTPGIAALSSKLIHQGNLRGMGWKFGKMKHLLQGYTIPLALSLIVYSLVWIFGLGELSVARWVKVFNDGASFTIGMPAVVIMILAAFVLLFQSMLTATGEEIGWTGFFTPQLLRLASPAKASLFIGLFWAVWHYPGILFSKYNAGTSPWVALPCFTIMVIGFSFIRTSLWMRSGSLWTGAVLHASHNLFIQSFFDIMTVDKGHSKYFTTEFGIGLAVIYGLAAVWIQRRWRRHPQRDPQTDIESEGILE